MKRLEPTELRVLVLAPVGRDASLVGETLHEAGIECQVCPDLVALRVEMQEGAGAIVVTEDLPITTPSTPITVIMPRPTPATWRRRRYGR